MLRDFVISTIVVLIAIAPMAFGAWYDSHLEPDAEH